MFELQGSVVSLSKKPYPYCLVLVGSKTDLSAIYIWEIACFTLKLK